MNIAVPNLAPGAIHVWELDLDHFFVPNILGEDEKARAAKFRFDHDRKRFTNGRAALRILVGGYLKMTASDVVFEYGAAGKPFVRDSKLSFNLAHSESSALIAFTLEKQIGADIERIRAMDDMPAVARLSFSDGEFQRWSALATELRARAFYRCWTRKEAFLKASGEGIARRLKAFEVSFEPRTEPSIIKGVNEPWTLLDLSREPEYAAAIAYEGTGPTLEKFSLASV